MAEVPYFVSLEEALLITKTVGLDIESEVVDLDNLAKKFPKVPTFSEE